MSRTRARSSRKASMTWPTTTRHTLRTTLGIALIGILVACSGTSAPSATSEDRQLPTAWPYANHDLSNTRATTDSTINSSDVSQLGIAWTHPIAGVGAYGAAASTPLVSNGTVYFQDLGSNVTALSVDDGSEVWTTRFDNSVIGPNGPALDGNSVIAASSKDAITALDASTGDKRWTTTLVKSPTAGVDIQPVAYDGLVYTSTVPGNQSSFYAGGDSGVITALNTDTGKVAWTFDTVKPSNLWGDPKVNSGGGAWYPPAIDESTGMSYWGTGNPAPWPGVPGQPNGSSRPGNNLYTSSIVALDHSTGKLEWYDQVRPHDLFDLDFQSSPILLGANGSQPAEVVGSGKAGIVAAYDPDTGKQLWSTPVGDGVRGGRRPARAVHVHGVPGELVRSDQRRGRVRGDRRRHRQGRVVEEVPHHGARGRDRRQRRGVHGDLRRPHLCVQRDHRRAAVELRLADRDQRVAGSRRRHDRVAGGCRQRQAATAARGVPDRGHRERRCGHAERKRHAGAGTRRRWGNVEQKRARREDARRDGVHAEHAGREGRLEDHRDLRQRVNPAARPSLLRRLGRHGAEPRVDQGRDGP